MLLGFIAADKGIEVTVRRRATVFIIIVIIPTNEGMVMLFIGQSPWQLRVKYCADRVN